MIDEEQSRRTLAGVDMIARFMGGEMKYTIEDSPEHSVWIFPDRNGYVANYSMGYDRDLKEQMKVVDRIVRLVHVRFYCGYDLEKKYYAFIGGYGDTHSIVPQFMSVHKESVPEAVFEALVKFVIWYNQIYSGDFIVAGDYK